MQNFRPPAMDEVVKKQNKAKRSLNIIIILSMIVVAFAIISSLYKIKSTVKPPTVQDRYNTLINYYNALVVNDYNKLSSIAPSINHEINPLIGTERQYSLYVFDDSKTNKNEFTFQVTDHHINEEKIYINRVIFSEKSANLILEIESLYSGEKIN
ncbi:MAG: hypothetical protein ACRCTJ_05820 [Brevinema sp.]